MGLQIPLPHSKKGPYKGNFWPIFEKDMLSLQSDPSADKLEEIILKNINRGIPSPLGELPNLRNVLKKTDTNSKLIVFISDLALKLPTLFPDGHLQCLERQSKQLETLSEDGVANGEAKGDSRSGSSCVKLTRHQVACLLSHMFLCTILPWKDMARSHCGHFTGARAPTGNIDQQELGIY